jgi:hypothetical protein
MRGVKKITVEVPSDLLLKAQQSTGQGVTATVRRGLELVVVRKAYKKLRRFRGRVGLSIDLEKLRDDRSGLA